MIWQLVKVNLLATLSMLLRQRKKNATSKQKKPILAIIIATYVFCVLMLATGVEFKLICAPLFEAEAGWLYFAIVGIAVFMLCFVGSVFMVQHQLFGAKDNDLLLSMPIKPSAILAGRLCALLLEEYIYAAVIFLPSLAVLVITGNIHMIPVAGLLMFIVAILTTPVGALAVGCLIGWLVALATVRARLKKILNVVLPLILFAFIFWFQFNLTSNIAYLMGNGASIAESVRKSIPPAYFIGMASAAGSFVHFIAFIACMAIPSAIMLIALSHSFFKLAAGERTTKKKIYKEKGAKVTGIGMALFMRELRRYLSMPLYIINNSLGAILALVAAVVLFVRPEMILPQLNLIAGQLFTAFEVGYMPAIVLSVFAVLNIVSAPSVSLEGNALWVVKSLPVETWQVLSAKTWLHMATCGLPIAVAGVACIYTFPMYSQQMIMTFALPLSVTLFFAHAGLTLNLQFPRFDWTNPMQPVKQSVSTLLSVFGGIALVVTAVLLYMFLQLRSMLGQYLLCCTLVMLLASAILRLYIMSGGCRKFDTL